MMDINSNFWSNKKVLVTGHTGFKGSWLSQFLKYQEAKVCGLSNYDVISDNYHSMDKNIFTEEFELDIVSDIKDVESLFLKNEFEVVFHLAAQGIVSTAKANPLGTINSNIVGTFNVLNSINQASNPSTLVISTTDKVYLNTSINNIESDHLGGKEFYSASKAATEHIISAFTNSEKKQDLNVGVIRSGNVLGGGDGGKDRIQTDVIKSLKNGEDIVLRNPKSVRPWQFILDSISGYVLTAQYCNENRKNEIFNLNSKPNNDYTVENLVKAFICSWTSKKINIIHKNSDMYESDILTIDSSKANKLLNWKAIEDINSIASKTVKWEKENMKGNNISFLQIEEYLN
jgi:CDP-glucose 4,6-dehydratase